MITENVLVTLTDFGYIYLINCYIKSIKITKKETSHRVTL